MQTERFCRLINGLETVGPIKEEKYGLPTEVIFGRGALAEIDRQRLVTGKKKVFLVIGEHFQETEALIRLKTKLAKEKKVLVYGRKIVTSDFKTINTLTDFVRNEEPDLIMAIGGGTVLDVGKCAAILAVHEGNVEDYLETKTRQLEKKGTAFVAVPTTAGTGSEVTPWATVWDKLNKEKYSLTVSLMFPDLAIVDPSLTDSLPAKTTAESGIDALTQAIEAYWSVKHNPLSDEFALEAIKLAMVTLEKAVNHPDREVRDKMSKASLLAGLAFNNTATTICHAVSYPMTAYFDVTHGQAVAITLPKFIEYSLPVLEKERRETLLEALGVKNEKEAAEKITGLMKNCGLMINLSELGIKANNIDLIVSKGFHPDRAKNAPRIPTPQELKKMLISLL